MYVACASTCTKSDLTVQQQRLNTRAQPTEQRLIEDEEIESHRAEQFHLAPDHVRVFSKRQ